MSKALDILAQIICLVFIVAMLIFISPFLLFFAPFAIILWAINRINERQL